MKEKFRRCFPHLVLHRNLSSESVIRVPFLIETQAQLLQLVLGLQTPTCLASVNISRARCVEFLETNMKENLRIKPNKPHLEENYWSPAKWN